MAMGYAFQPGADQLMGPGNGQTGRSVPAPASSVKTLSFRMPKQNVRGAVAPAALLNASGSAGAPTGGLSPQLLSLLLAAFSAPSQQGPGMFDGGSSDPAGVHGPSAGSFGPPKFTIGDGGRLPMDLGQGFATGPRQGEIPQGGLTVGPDRSAMDRSGVSPGPRYKMIDDSLSMPFGQPFDPQGQGRMFF